MKREFFRRKRDAIFLMIIFSALFAVVMNMSGAIKVVDKLFEVMKPILIGCLMAFILNIIVGAWESIYFKGTTNKFIIKTRRGICILLSIISVFLMFYVISKLVIPQINKFLSVFVKTFPSLYDEIKGIYLHYASNLPHLNSELFHSKGGRSIDGQEILKKLAHLIATWTGGIVIFLNSLFGIITNIVMGFIVAIYIVAGKETLLRQFDKLFRKILPEKRRKRFYHFLDVSNTTFKSFLIGQFIEAIILGSLCAVGLFIFGFPYAAMIGSIVGSTALIPLVGAYIGGAFGFLTILSVSTFKALIFIVFLVVLQQIEGNVIYPKVVGSSVGLPGLWVMIAILIGGGLGGIVGVLFSVPVAATIYKLIKLYVNKDDSIKKDTAVTPDGVTATLKQDKSDSSDNTLKADKTDSDDNKSGN